MSPSLDDDRRSAILARMPRTLRPELLALFTALFAAAPLASAETVAPAKAAASTTAPATTTVGAPLPTAKTDGATFAVDGEAILITNTATKATVRLHPIAAAIYALADGKTSLEAIRKGAEDASGYAIDEATLFAALDALADAKLLVARATPPGGSPEQDLVVLADGAATADLVAVAADAKPGRDDFAKVKVAESAAKRKLRDRHRDEESVKAKQPLRKKSEEAHKAAYQDYVKAKAQLDADKAAGKLKGEAEAKKFNELVQAKRVRAEEAAKKERVERREGFKKESAEKAMTKKGL